MEASTTKKRYRRECSYLHKPVILDVSTIFQGREARRRVKKHRGVK